jgi:hypothetical protein
MKRCKRGHGVSLASAFLSTALASTAASAATRLEFDKAFTDRNEPKQAHYRATYSLNGQEHQVEIWRDRNVNLKRRTDDAIETHVFKPPGQVEWKMVVLDLKRKIRTDIDRTNLYRIGHFTDWFSLAHSLTRPNGPYDLATLHEPVASAAPIATCRWYLLTQGERSSKVCWSAAWRVPLLITDRNDKVQWKITELDSGRFAADALRVDDHGFVRNNANEDIKAD